MSPAPTRLPWRSGARPPGFRKRNRQIANVVLVCAAVVTLALVFVALSRDGTDQGATSSPGPGVTSSLGDDPSGAEASEEGSGSASAEPSDSPSGAADGPDARLAAAISAALEASELPAFAPPVSSLGTVAWARAAERAGCLDTDLDALQRCAFGPPDSPDTVMVVGDDAAAAYVPAVRAALENRFRIQQLTLRGCPVWDAPVEQLTGGPYPECDFFRTRMIDAVRRAKPDVLVMVTSWQTGARLDGGSADDVLAGYDRVLAELASAARVAVVLSAPPAGTDLQACVTPAAVPDDCVAQVPEAYETVAETERQIAEGRGAVYVDTRSWFCVEDACPGFVGRTPVYADGVRVTQAFATRLAPVMLDALVGAAEVVREQEGE